MRRARENASVVREGAPIRRQARISWPAQDPRRAPRCAWQSPETASRAVSPHARTHAGTGRQAHAHTGTGMSAALQRYRNNNQQYTEGKNKLLREITQESHAWSPAASFATVSADSLADFRTIVSGKRHVKDRERSIILMSPEGRSCADFCCDNLHDKTAGTVALHGEVPYSLPARQRSHACTKHCARKKTQPSSNCCQVDSQAVLGYAGQFNPTRHRARNKRPPRRGVEAFA